MVFSSSSSLKSLYMESVDNMAGKVKLFGRFSVSQSQACRFELCYHSRNIKNLTFRKAWY